MKKCTMCKKETRTEELKFKVFDGKGSFVNTCSEECAKQLENIYRKEFNRNLKHYRKLHKELDELINNNKDDDLLNEKITEKKQEIEILESLYNFSIKMLVN